MVFAALNAGTVKLMDYGRKKAIFLNFRQQEVFE
jgi:hypothetical protein